MVVNDKRSPPLGKEDVIKILLMGPANAGKSELGSRLEEIFNGERKAYEGGYETSKRNPTSVGRNSSVDKDHKKEASVYKPTPGVAFYKFSLRKTGTNKHEHELEFVHWELGGQERYQNLWSIWWAGARGVIVVLDSCKTSDDNYLKEARRILDIIETKIKKPYIICANKQDLQTAIPAHELRKRLQLWTRPSYLGTFPISALSGENVKKVLLRFLSSIGFNFL
ncbi:ADP-ribosylation factor-like protein [Candidatus Borrarchaeum sp.]|uniref:ADP-ribosylation factor-like protein n=1 Tax=Candidatus Borrarchaeum sp. TaxID=2846742 RepID=UPI00257AB392|nr:ADP-ribosylation factor-like protein [Candidatus Borrarchaeum sp.]